MGACGRPGVCEGSAHQVHPPLGIFSRGWGVPCVCLLCITSYLVCSRGWAVAPLL